MQICGRRPNYPAPVSELSIQHSLLYEYHRGWILCDSPTTLLLCKLCEQWRWYLWCLWWCCWSRDRLRSDRVGLGFGCVTGPVQRSQRGADSSILYILSHNISNQHSGEAVSTLDRSTDSCDISTDEPRLTTMRLAAFAGLSLRRFPVS